MLQDLKVSRMLGSQKRRLTHPLLYNRWKWKLILHLVQKLAPLIARFMGPISGRQDPSGPHVGPMNLAIWEYTESQAFLKGKRHINTKLFIWKDTRRNDMDKKPIEFQAAVCYYIHPEPRDLITQPFPNINGGLAKPPLKLGHGRIVTQIAISWG